MDNADADGTSGADKAANLDLAGVFESVRDDIDAIEDKLYERGLLVASTGDTDAEVRITFDEWGSGGERGLYCIIAITAESSDEIDDAHFEEISDYVGSKIAEVSEFWGSNVREVLSESLGEVVLLNGAQIY